MKEGYKSTEFWISLIVTIGSLLGSLGVLTPEEASSGTQSVTQIVGGVVTLVALIRYVSARQSLKAAAMRK